MQFFSFIHIKEKFFQFNKSESERKKKLQLYIKKITIIYKKEKKKIIIKEKIQLYIYTNFFPIIEKSIYTEKKRQTILNKKIYIIYFHLYIYKNNILYKKKI